MHDLSTTLVAVATAPGRGAVGCVRLSGDRAWEIARVLFREGGSPRIPSFGILLDDEGRAIDHGFLVEFPPGRSFTGEPSAELWAHGSPAVLATLVDAALRRGAVHAGPGEFTYRALRHGRIDLSRAEAIRDLIAARTRHQARVAFSQVQGATARRVAPLRERLLDLSARAEATVEFVDDAEVETSAGILARELPETLGSARELLQEARRGRVLREGARVAICGAPSVGKSSIFNRFAGLDRAIVSEVPGTTRDTLEETIDLDGLAVTLVDTAGLRPVDDPVEAEGVRRARAAAQESDLTILVLDASREPTTDERTELADSESPRLVVANKRDLVPLDAPLPYTTAVPVSTLTGDGWEDLRRILRRRLNEGEESDVPALTHARHVLALERVVASLARAMDASAAGLSEEVVLLDLRESLEALGEITGEAASEDLYDRIFSTFCIGK